MKVGYISQTAWKKNIAKLLHRERPESLLAPSQEEMCGAFHTGAEEIVVTSANVSGMSANTGLYAVLKAVNDLACRGARPLGIMVHVMLPLKGKESFHGAVMQQIEGACQTLGIGLYQANAEVTPAVLLPVVNVTAVGAVQKDSLKACSKARPGQDIVLLGTVGLEGALRILEEREKELSARFVPAFLQQTRRLSSQLYALPWIQLADQTGKVSAMQQIGDGGILAALWGLLEAAGLGMEIEMSKISVQQETIEICEFYRLNPYQMTSAGSVLMITDDADALIDVLTEAGARAGKLGVTTDTPARVIQGQSEKRYLDRPGPDELASWREQGLQ